MIIEKKDGKIVTYYVDKDYDDKELTKILNKKLSRTKIHFIIDHDADVYTKDGKLLLRFRKNVLNKTNVDDFYKNVIGFALNKTSNRGSASGSNNKNVKDNPEIMTNIVGFFDKLSPKQKQLMRIQGKKINITARETRFNMDYPDTDVRVIFDEDEEEFKIIFDIDVTDIDDVDTFLCEEIAQEYEVYCEILNDYNCNSKSYYYDEEDKWFYE